METPKETERPIYSTETGNLVIWYHQIPGFPHLRYVYFTYWKPGGKEE